MLTTLLYNRLNYVIKVNYFLRLFNYFLTAVSANYVFIQPAPGVAPKMCKIYIQNYTR
jgi:hypothetical protein